MEILKTLHDYLYLEISSKLIGRLFLMIVIGLSFSIPNLSFAGTPVHGTRAANVR
jgi:hypothetical protein